MSDDTSPGNVTSVRLDTDATAGELDKLRAMLDQDGAYLSDGQIAVELYEHGSRLLAELAAARATIAAVEKLHAENRMGNCDGCATHVTFTPFEKCRTRAALAGEPGVQGAAKLPNNSGAGDPR